MLGAEPGNDNVVTLYMFSLEGAMLGGRGKRQLADGFPYSKKRTIAQAFGLDDATRG